MTEIVATPLLMRLRKLWFQVHKWIALALVVLLIPLGLSGVVLAWDDAIDHALNPQRYAAQGPARLPPSAYTAAARAAIGSGSRIATIRYPEGDGPVTVVLITGPNGGMAARRTVWLDPRDGRVLDRERANSGLVRVAHLFHGNLLLPVWGRAVVGLLGVAMVLLAASGVWLWWPPHSRWTRGLRWRRGDRGFDTNLHHMIGFWIAIPLAAQAFTGAWIAWPQMMAVLGFGGGQRPRAQQIAAPSLSPDLALADALRVASGSPAAIAWPADRDGRWRVTVLASTGPADVAVGDADGTTGIARRHDGGLAMAVRHLHDGTTLGFYWRMVMVPIGLAPTVLGVTGVLMWRRTRRWRKRRARIAG